MKKHIILLVIYLSCGSMPAQSLSVIISQSRSTKSVDVCFVKNKYTADVWMNVVKYDNSGIDNAIIFSTHRHRDDLLIYPTRYVTPKVVKIFLFGIEEPIMPNMPTKRINEYKCFIKSLCVD